MYKTEFRAFIDEINTHLLEYLEEKGINTARTFKCLNPEHEDSRPSMTCAQAPSRGHTVYCFGCGACYDLVRVYSILEETPSCGSDWMSGTVLPLARKYKVKPPTLELSVEEQFVEDLYFVYRTVASRLNHEIKKMSPEVQNYVETKGWTEKTLQELDIGTIDYEALAVSLEQNVLARFGLNRPDIFAKTSLIFTIRNAEGEPIRFFARQLHKDNTGPKFLSTGASSLLVNVWSDHGHLYQGHLLDSITSRQAIIVEGQPAAASLYQAGFKNVVASCGVTQFSEQHADTLIMAGITEAIIAFDGDDKGKEGTKRLLSQEFVKAPGLRYSVLQLPPGHDPDTFMRENGPDKFKYLVDIRVSSFNYLLQQFDPSTKPDELCKLVLPHIATDQSEIAREMMARELSTFLNEEVSVRAILADVKRMDAVTLNAIAERQKAIVGAVVRQAQGDPGQAKEAFREAVKRLEDVENEAGLGKKAENAFLIRVQECKEIEERPLTDIPKSFTLQEGSLQTYADVLKGGTWAYGQVLIFGAVENMGKSAFVNSLAWQIVANPANEARVLIQTLDDSLETVVHRLVCNAYGKPSLTMNMVANPAMFAEEVPNVYEMREVGYSRVMNLVQAGKILIRDVSDGKTISYAETQLQELRRKYPEDNLVYVLDNFHNVDDWGTLDMRQRFTNASHYLKNLTTLYRCTVICTAEYRKNDPSKMGSNDDLAEARALKYDAKGITHLFSDAHIKGADNACYVHRGPDGKLRPRIWAYVQKNKVTDQRVHLFYDFWPASSLFTAVSEEKAQAEYYQRKEELTARKGHGEEDNGEEDGD